METQGHNRKWKPDNAKKLKLTNAKKLKLINASGANTLDKLLHFKADFVIVPHIFWPLLRVHDFLTF
jgi:hypothetical protein